MRYLLCFILFLVGCKDPNFFIPHTNQDLAKVKMGHTFDQVSNTCGFPDKYTAFEENGMYYQVLLYRIEGELPYDLQKPNNDNIFKAIEENVAYDFEGKKLITPQASIELKYTPVLIRNDKVIGIGWRSFNANGINLSNIKDQLESL